MCKMHFIICGGLVSVRKIFEVIICTWLVRLFTNKFCWQQKHLAEKENLLAKFDQYDFKIDTEN